MSETDASPRRPSASQVLGLCGARGAHRARTARRLRRLHAAAVRARVVTRVARRVGRRASGLPADGGAVSAEMRAAVPRAGVVRASATRPAHLARPRRGAGQEVSISPSGNLGRVRRRGGVFKRGGASSATPTPLKTSYKGGGFFETRTSFAGTAVRGRWRSSRARTRRRATSTRGVSSRGSWRATCRCRRRRADRRPTPRSATCSARRGPACGRPLRRRPPRPRRPRARTRSSPRANRRRRPRRRRAARNVSAKFCSFPPGGPESWMLAVSSSCLLDTRVPGSTRSEASTTMS